MRVLLKGFVFRVIYMGAVFLISLLIARLAGTAVFGVISLMIVNAALFLILTGLGTDSAIVWHGITGKSADRDKIFSFTFYTSLLQLFLFIAAAFFYFSYAGKSVLTGGHDSKIFYVELVYFAGLVLTEKYSALYYSQQLAALCNKLLAVSLCLLLLSLVAFMIFWPGPVTNNPVEVIAIVTIIPAIILILVYHIKNGPVLKKPERSTVISFAGFSIIVFITNLVQFMAYRIDFWIIDYYHGKSDVGIYAQATKFSQLLWVIPAILAGLIVPALKRGDKSLGVVGLLSIIRLLFYSHVALGIILIGGSYILYYYFLPAGFADGFYPLLLMMPGYLLFIITTILAAFFSANRFLSVNLVGSVICLAVMLIADLILIPRFAYSGAAIANTIAYSVTSFYFMYKMTRKTRAVAGDYFIIRKSDLKTLKNEIVNVPGGQIKH